jgi:hypothetical protein
VNRPLLQADPRTVVVARSNARYGKQHIVINGKTICGLDASSLLTEEVPTTVYAVMTQACGSCRQRAGTMWRLS